MIFNFDTKQYDSEKHYSDLLKPELPKEEKEEQKTGA